MTKRSHTQTEEILQSLDGLQHATAPDFFYTRLSARMLEPEKQAKAFILRPALITTILSVVLLVNIASLVTLNKKRPADPATIESFAEAYGLTNTSSY